VGDEVYSYGKLGQCGVFAAMFYGENLLFELGKVADSGDVCIGECEGVN